MDKPTVDLLHAERARIVQEFLGTQNGWRPWWRGLRKTSRIIRLQNRYQAISELLSHHAWRASIPRRNSKPKTTTER